MTESYAAGETTPDLLDETIGANFERTVAAYGGNEALVEFATGRRWTYDELNRDVDALARGLIGAGIAKGDRVGVWAPNCAEWTISQYAAAKVGAILVNVNPSYRTHEFSYAVNQSGLRMLISAVEFKTSELPRDGRGDGRRRTRASSGSSTSAPTTGPRCSPTARGCPTTRSPSGWRRCEPGDAINIQYTSGTTGYPKGATLSPPQHPQQRLLHDRDDQPHRRGPALHPGALLPLLRHGDGQPRLHHATAPRW